jgi:hypothetical protein
MMARQSTPRGKCVFCGREFTRGGLVTHLKACPDRAEAVAKADAGRGRAQRLFHLQVQDAWAGDFWLHLEMNGTATMGALDSYLRAIWLECCGHLSTYFIGPAWTGDEVSISRHADAVLTPGLKLLHLYDFGTTSETSIQVVDVREGRPLTTHPIYLMARNDLPPVKCAVCGEPATQFCTECMYDDSGAELLCDVHAETHECDPDYLVPIVNSPRVGMCGYYGPAEPPY